jgi:hypothetical protein
MSSTACTDPKVFVSPEISMMAAMVEKIVTARPVIYRFCRRETIIPW